MTKRFWIGWGVCGAAIALVWLGWWATHPVSADATGGSTYQRTGGVVLLLIIPTVLSARRLTKIDDEGSPAMWVVPALLAFVVVIVSLLVGYLPDKPTDCARLSNFESFDVSPPYCTTIGLVRARAWVEASVLWLVFGALVYAFDRMSAAKKRRTESATA